MVQSLQPIAWALISLILTQSFAPPAWAANPLWDKIKQLGPRQGHPPETSRDGALEELASNIDWLEHELDQWGTVVPKTPDVWGEARLTQYRYEVEQQLKNEINGFQKDHLSGAQFVSDEAALSAAMSFNFAPAGNTVRPLPISSALNNTTVTVPGGTASEASESGINISSTIADTTLGNSFLPSPPILGFTSGIKLEQTEQLNQLKGYLDHLNALRRINEGDDVSDAPGYSLSLVRIPISILPGTHSREGYGAEITVTATAEIGPDLLLPTFRDFVINDLVDQWSIPLTRFLNDDPHVSREALDSFTAYEQDLQGWTQWAVPAAPLFVDIFHKLNYMISEQPQFGQQVSQALNGIESEFYDAGSNYFMIDAPEIQRLMATHPVRFLRESYTVLKPIEGLEAIQEMSPRTDSGSIASAFPLDSTGYTYSDTEGKTGAIWGAFYQGTKLATASLESSSEQETPGLSMLPDAQSREATRKFEEAKLFQERQLLDALWQRFQDLERHIKSIEKSGEKLASYESIPSHQGRKSTLPFPPSQLTTVMSIDQSAHVANWAYQAFKGDIINRQIVHITDVQALLRSEFSAAYERLSLESAQHLWDRESGGQRELYLAIRRNDFNTIRSIRNDFLEAISRDPALNSSPHPSRFNAHLEDLVPSNFHNAPIAWGVYVESILLNERLREDMQQTANSAGGNMAPHYWMPFFGPNPSLEARQAFADYVKAKWPIKIFTVDPVSTEQNIADFSAISRQMQLAIAMSVAGGELGVGAALNTLRKIKREMATVDLNRTVVGFSHTDNSFGWQFYPRFQNAPVESNLKVFFRDLVAGGPTDDQLLRSRQIEPGIRECTALVLMPSFVPSVRFDTRGNWFKLTRPGHTAISVKENLEYSRSIEAMRNNALACVRHPDRYRPGELERLLQRVNQLDATLPLQTLHCQVPMENSLGGFEILSNGTRELSPELLGWYGTPGYDSAKGATVFLVGDNFNVRQTAVLAGNRQIQIDSMLSRQVIQVHLPPNLPILKDSRLAQMAPGDYSGYVDIHLATPYGVSGHMLLPAVQPEKQAAPAGIVFRNGYLSALGKISVTSAAPPASATHQLESLEFEDNSTISLQLPALDALSGTATLKVQLYQSLATGLQLVDLGSAVSLTGEISTDTHMLTIPREELAKLQAPLKSFLGQQVSDRQLRNDKRAFALAGTLTIGNLVSDEPVTGHIPLTITMSN